MFTFGSVETRLRLLVSAEEFSDKSCWGGWVVSAFYGLGFAEDVASFGWLCGMDWEMIDAERRGIVIPRGSMGTGF